MPERTSSRASPRTASGLDSRGPKRVYSDGSRISSYFAAVNRGKRSIRIDLKSDAGRALALRLISDADVLVENFSPGTLTRLGLDLTDLRSRFPRLITASVSLFGVPETAGALSGRGGLAIVAEA